MRYEVHLHMAPPTATAQHKGSRAVCVGGRWTVLHYTKRPQKMAHDMYMEHLQYDIANREDGIGSYKMFTTPIVVCIDFLFANPSSTPKKLRNTTFAKTTRPDVDNMAKGLIDCLTEVGLIQDDALIFDLRLRKFTTSKKREGVRISITDELDGYTMDDGDKEEQDNG